MRGDDNGSHPINTAGSFLRAAEIPGAETKFTQVGRNQQYISRNFTLYCPRMRDWTFLTNHARVLLCVAHDPEVRLRDIAGTLDITERSAYGIVTDLAEAGYLVKEKDGRRNRYQIQGHLPLRESISREQTIGELLDLLVNTNTHRRTQRSSRPRKRIGT
jgi:hypothetical protein